MAEAMSREALPALPREMVLASAGTGKTFRISSRIIGLLALGAPADTIFASTFTRKAAGEILDRVLTRLADAAIDHAKAAELAVHARLPGQEAPDARPDAWLRVLERLVRELHRVNIGTLDAFFVRAATIFADEVGLPRGWRIAEQQVMDRLRAESVQDVLASRDTGAILELARSISGSDAARSIHRGLLARAKEVLELHRSIDPGAHDPWSGLAPHVEPVPADVAERVAALSARLDDATVPLTKDGRPMAAWRKAIDTAAERLRAGEWDELVGSNICTAATCDGGTFNGRPVPEELCEIFSDVCRLARSVIGARLDVQGRALGRLAELLAAAVDRKQHETGAYDFTDLTRLIGGPDPLGTRGDLYYRLDARTQHILLDEFQDTSLVQWEALEPLLAELLSGYEHERAAVVVADPKQSIYAWRGGEPVLVGHVEEHYVLARDEMHRSYRSSPVVLGFVNEVFGSIDENGAWGEDAVASGVAGEWREAFAPHESAHPDLPGHVRVVVGPPDDGQGTQRPMLCRSAAELVAELHAQAPGRTIGVLTRTNRTVARMMMYLRALGVHASEEGGNPLTDSPAVGSVLALLRLSEHPGDRIARYHVAGTPVGAAVGLTDHDDRRAADGVAHELRRRLLLDGYGPTLADLVARVEEECSPRDRRRLGQLVELAFRYDDRATLRVSEFLRLVETERIEDPTASDVRVMTVHQSKGLEFDVVVLPELDSPMEGSTRGSPPLAYRPGRAGRVTRAFPYVKQGVRRLFSDVDELQAAVRDARAGRIRDGLSALYVALTRARHALHVVVKPDGQKGMTGSCTAASILRHALGATDDAAEGEVLHESGDPDWYVTVPARRAPAAPGAGAGEPRRPSVIRLRSGEPRTRGFARRAPSELAAGSTVDLRMVLNLRSAAVEGTIAHAWMERIGWIEEGLPSEDELRAVASSVDPGYPRELLEKLLARWRGWVADPTIREALEKAAYGPNAEYEREVRFIHRDDDAVMEGAIDRLVVVREGGRVTGAVVLDYKTDTIERGDREALESKATMYRPQLDAYRRTVAGWYGIPREAVRCRLVVLDAGAVVEV